MADSFQNAPADAWTGRLVGGRWRILSLLDDSGGMASVYLAEDERLPRKAVVKIPRAAQFNAEFAERFTREAHWHAQVSDRNVVHILDRGEEQGTPYLVLQYLPGGNLKAWCGRNPSLLADPRLHYESWLLPIAQALDTVAAQGIVHRDVKPSNILFDAVGQAYLSDFGIVKAGSDATMTGTGLFIGTLQFMSPEQCRPEAKRGVDGRSDQYGLGVTLYQVLTGWKYPVEDDTAVVYAAKFGHVAMTPPRNHDPRIPRAVEDAVMRSLSTDRDRRFGSSVEFAKAVLDGFGAAAHPRPAAMTPAAAATLATAMPAASVAQGTPKVRPGPVETPPAGPVTRKPSMPSRMWRWFRDLPEAALVAAISRLWLGIMCGCQLLRGVQTSLSVRRYFSDSLGGEPYWQLPVGGDAVRYGTLLAAVLCAVVVGWGGKWGRIAAALLLGGLVLTHAGLAVRGISPAMEAGHVVPFGVGDPAALAWALVAGMSGSLLLIVCTAPRCRGEQRAADTSTTIILSTLARGLIVTPVVAGWFDTIETIAGYDWVLFLIPCLAVSIALLAGVRTRTTALVILFTSLLMFVGPIDVPMQYFPVVFGWLCGLMLIVTDGAARSLTHSRNPS